MPILRTPALVERTFEVEFQMQRNPQGTSHCHVHVAVGIAELYRSQIYSFTSGFMFRSFLLYLIQGWKMLYSFGETNHPRFQHSNTTKGPSGQLKNHIKLSKFKFSSFEPRAIMRTSDLGSYHQHQLTKDLWIEDGFHDHKMKKLIATLDEVKS